MSLMRSKKNKTPGPYNVHADLAKWLDQSNQTALLETINHTFTTEYWESSLDIARVASIYKKGYSSQLATYRPISLLQTFYKIIAALVKERIANVIDRKIIKAQFGFRKGDSTAHATYLARSLLDQAEAQSTI